MAKGKCEFCGEVKELASVWNENDAEVQLCCDDCYQQQGNKLKMKKYIGTKIIMAARMSAEDASRLLGSMPLIANAKEKIATVGDGLMTYYPSYLVEYPDGYRSWIPKAQFEESYRELCGMTFGQAIEAMKIGRKVARSGWNGKGMYLWLLPAATIKKEWVKDEQLLEVFGDRDELECLGSIRMKTATGEVLTGWLASQTDMLAEDWEVVE